MALIADGGGGGPTLDPKAKHYERELFKVFSSSTSTIWLTQEDWRAARTQLEDLAKDVQQVRSELQAPSDGGKGWQGAAAEAALASLEKLSTTLDGHAAEIGDVDTSLGQVYTAISDAKAAWYSDVASISTYVDPSDHMRLPAPYAPTPENRDTFSVPDVEAAAAAEDALWEQRNQAAKAALERLEADTQAATGTMPIDTNMSDKAPYTPTGPGPSTNYPTGTSTPSSGGGGYQIGEVVGTGLQQQPSDTGGETGQEETSVPEPEEPTVITIGDPPGPDPDPTPTGPETGTDPDPISSDGAVTGTTGVAPGGHGGPAGPGSMPGPGGGGLGGLAAGGVGTGAAGLGGLLGARGGGLFGSRGATGSAPRPGGAAGRPGQAAPGGTQGRSSTSARSSAVKGATGSGRYGVPKLDGKGGGPAAPGQGAKSGARGATGGSGRGGATRGGPAGRGGAAVGAAGTRGARQDDRDQAPDVDSLTHEDEETWFDGSDDSSPQVWD